MHSIEEYDSWAFHKGKRSYLPAEIADAIELSTESFTPTSCIARFAGLNLQEATEMVFMESTVRSRVRSLEQWIILRSWSTMLFEDDSWTELRNLHCRIAS
jgi:hypothetical protein